MQCPKCKNQISDDVLRCPHCNLKVKIVCPECQKVSLMGKKFCDECGYQFFAPCPICNTINFSEAETCRKCHSPLHEKQEKIIKEEALPVIEAEQTVSAETVSEDSPQKEKFEPVIQEEPVIEEKNIPVQNEDGYFVSSDDIDISDSQLQNIIEKVEEIDKNQVKKAEAQALIQKKFEQQQEIEHENEEEIPPEYVQLNQAEAQKTIIEAVQNPLKRVISLSGKEGFGKSLILKYVFDALRKNENYICALGECSALTQITPFGYIQDVMLNICNLSNFSVNLEDFIKNNTRAMEAKFFNLKQQEIHDLFNFLYPFKGADFNGILNRKEYTINILKKVVENLTIKSTVVFMVDDFENIDGASFDFIKNILSDEKFNEKIKIIITNKYNKIAQGYFYNNDLKPNNYSNIFLSGLDKPQCVQLINTLFGGYIDMPKEIENQIFENSKGTSAYIEQACQLLGD